jgi:cysteine-rich repeat protein
VNVWQVGNRHYANVVSLCVPGTAICGDGVFDAFCEVCDDGPGNSDTTPDACRTTCERPRCGDGVTDGGEECDDGNATPCDGCSACRVDVGLGCGDGIAIPACGETCDDGNAVVGDGCAPDCRLERAPGGGPAPTDCFTAWSIDNPANEPLRDKTGAMSRAQECVDDDPRCDFDGGTPGSCTFHVRVCVNNTDLAACTPGTRLAGWTLRAPSASRAAHDVVAAAQRTALSSAVLPNVVGPSARDLCSPTAAMVVPLRPGGRAAKVTLKTDASLYTGERDIDKLRLTCFPAAP